MVFTSLTKVSTNRTLYLGGGPVSSLVDGECRAPVPMGAARKLWVSTTVAPGAGSLTYAIRKNGQVTALSVTLTGASKTGSDLVDTVNYNEGDDIDVVLINAGAPEAYHIATILFDPNP